MTIHNLGQWRAFVAQAATPPPCDESSPDSAEGKAERIQRIGQLVIPNPEFNGVQKALDVYALGRTPGAAAPALIQGISGPASVGKSTATMHHARLYEIRRRQEMGLHPIIGSALTRDLPNGAAYVPVVRITAQAGPVKTLQSVVTYFGFDPDRQRSPRDQISRLFESCGTEIIYVEQFNAFQGSPAGAAAVSEQLKFLSEATSGLAMVIVGIDLEYEILHANDKTARILAQLLDRATIQTMRHPDPLTSQGRKDYHGLLRTWEEHLPLLNKEPGDLVKHADQIAEATDNAKTARLTALIRGCARLAILDGSERILGHHIATVAGTTRKTVMAVATATAPRARRASSKRALSA
jgi:hypothetical protein